MIIIVTNRNVNTGRADDRLFGEQLNTAGQNASIQAELRIATATCQRKSRSWKLALRPEPASPKETDMPSRKLFEQVIKNTRAGKLTKNWVFFIHGNNQSMLKNLNKCSEIEQTYKVNVLAFSWPSNPGPQGLLNKKEEYLQARRNARASVNALDRTLEKLSGYMAEYASEGCNIRISLLAHSLGSYLLKQFVLGDSFQGETKIFNNIILHAADVDHQDHAQWVNSLSQRRVYVTINENDWVLHFSEKANPPRLGKTASDLNSQEVVYIDFTGGRHVGNNHRIFYESRQNTTIKKFFTRGFTGQRAEVVRGLDFNSSLNAYQLSDRYHEEEFDEDLDYE